MFTIYHTVMPPTVLSMEWPVNIYKTCIVFLYIPQAGACFDIMRNTAKRQFKT